MGRARRRPCIDCGTYTIVHGVDEPAVCRECVDARTRAEAKLARERSDAGARQAAENRGLYGLHRNED